MQAIHCTLIFPPYAAGLPRLRHARRLFSFVNNFFRIKNRRSSAVLAFRLLNPSSSGRQQLLVAHIDYVSRSDYKHYVVFFRRFLLFSRFAAAKSRRIRRASPCRRRRQELRRLRFQWVFRARRKQAVSTAFLRPKSSKQSCRTVPSSCCMYAAEKPYKCCRSF